MLVRGSSDKSIADHSFFDFFLPRELKLLQQVSKSGGSRAISGTERFLGLYVVRLESPGGEALDEESSELATKSRHLLRLITSTIRYYDIPGQLATGEYFLVIREIYPQRAGLIASRLLGMASRSRVLSSGSLSLRIGYVVYPLSIEPDLAPTEWPRLVELARKMSGPADHVSDKDVAGHGLLRGPEMGSPTIPEGDLVNLAMTDLSSMLQANLLILEPVSRATGPTY
jgi:hypothetical protein